jgi:hypothetical protein
MNEMKLDLALNWKQYKELPEPLQKQIAARLGFALMFLFLFFLSLNLTADIMMTAPFICLTVYCALSATLLFRRAATGRYIVSRGRCADVVYTPIRRKPKAVLLEADDHMVRITLRRGLGHFWAGSELTVYAADDAPVYEKDGIMILQTYMAVHIAGGERDNHDKPSGS